MDQSENPIPTEAEVVKAVEEVKKDATEKSSEFVKDMKQTAKSLFGNVKESASHVSSKVENKVEKLVSDQWASIKNFGGFKDKTPHDQESGSKSTADHHEEVALPTSDKNVEEESSEDQKSGVEESCKEPENAHEVDENTRSSETQPFVAVTGETRASWMNCCGLLDVLKRSDE